MFDVRSVRFYDILKDIILHQIKEKQNIADMNIEIKMYNTATLVF